MSENKSIEVLTAELEALKKANIEREIALEKAKEDAALKLKEDEKQKALYDEIRQKVLTEMKGESKITKDTAEQKAGSDYEEYFRKPFIQRMGLKGLSYEELMFQLKNGTYGKGKGDAR